METKNPLWHVYFTKPLLAILFLGFSSGLPLLLVWSTLTAWFYEAKVGLDVIGILAAVRTPYSLKFLWAPLIDNLSLPLLTRILGRRRGWMLLTQFGLMASLLLMASLRPDTAPWGVAFAAALVAFLSASQDIVIDAYRIERLTPEEQGPGAAMIQYGYRIGMLVAGAGALALATYVGWQATYLIMAAMMGIGLVTTLIICEPASSALFLPLLGGGQVGVSHTKQDDMHNSQPLPNPPLRREGISAGQWLRHSVIDPFTDFTRHHSWWLILIFIVIYKLSDAFMGGMTTPFYLSLGFTKLTIAKIVKLYGLAATLLGIFLGGAFTSRWGAIPVLFVAGFLHALTNLLFVWQAHVGADANLLALSIVAENLSGGISSAAFVAYLSGLCNMHYTGTQYALLSSLATFGTTWFSTPAGYLAQYLGWSGFFIFAAALAAPGLILLYILNRRLINAVSLTVRKVVI